MGPHVPTSGRLKAFKLLNTSNAYWKGDARNQPMQRIYGTAFFSDKELQAYLTQIEEAKKRDHRKVGRELGLFHVPSVGAGATFWLDKGTTLYNLLAQLHARRPVSGRVCRGEDAARLQQGALGDVRALVALSREHVPHRASRRAGQGDPDAEQLALKAMNCPGHMLLFASEVRSYRDLPLRFHEQTPLHRNEVSGTLSGLTRVRQLSQDDAHCFVAQEQIGEEVERLLRLVQRVYADFGLPFEAKLVDAPAEFLGEAATWDSCGGAAEGARSTRVGEALHAQRRRRRVLRPEDRLRRHRCDRAEVAVRDDSARLPDARSAST